MADWDMGAGFVGWRKLPDGSVVVSCGIFELETHESWMLAVHARNRGTAFKTLRNYGVHRLKVNVNAHPPEDGLVDLAISAMGDVVKQRSTEESWPPRNE